MKQFLIKHWIKIAGILTGTLGGYLYYYYIGCVTGTCPITSNPYKMMLFGAIFGYLIFDMFSDNKSTKQMTKVEAPADEEDSFKNINDNNK